MTAMPNSSGSSRRSERSFTAPQAPRWATSPWQAAPAIRNSSPSRQGALSSIKGSSVALAAGLFTCQSQVT